MLFQEEYDTFAQAEQQIPSYFSYKCSFSRRGWEYRLANMRVFIEEIDKLPPSIEIEAGSQEEIFHLFGKIGIVSVLVDSAPEWYCHQTKVD